MIYWNVCRVKPAASSTMDISLKDTRLTLARDGLIALRDGRGTRIACLEGALWVTQEYSIKDEVLGPGQTLRVRQDGLTIVTALAPSALVLSEEHPLAASMGALWQRLTAIMGRPLVGWFGLSAARDSKPAWQKHDSHGSGDHFVRAI